MCHGKRLIRGQGITFRNRFSLTIWVLVNCTHIVRLGGKCFCPSEATGWILAFLRCLLKVVTDGFAWTEWIGRVMRPSPEYPATPPNQLYGILLYLHVALGSLGRAGGCRCG